MMLLKNVTRLRAAQSQKTAVDLLIGLPAGRWPDKKMINSPESH